MCVSRFKVLLILMWRNSEVPELSGLQEPLFYSSSAVRKWNWYFGYTANRNRRWQVCIFRAIYTYAGVFLESEPSHTAQNTESLPETINKPHFSSLICLHFANITSHPLPLTSSSYYQQAAEKSFPSIVSAACLWEIFSPLFFAHTGHDLQRLEIWGLIMEV